MTDGYEEAKSRRNALERLGEKIPGFRGYQDRELRRDVDKMQREHIAVQVLELKRKVRTKVQGFTDAGQIGALTGLDRLERRMDGLSQSIRFTDYGASGFFDVVKVYDEELNSLYHFDLALLDDVAALEQAIDAIPGPRGDGLEAAVEHALSLLGTFEEKWAGRKEIVSGVVRTR